MIDGFMPAMFPVQAAAILLPPRNRLQSHSRKPFLGYILKASSSEITTSRLNGIGHAAGPVAQDAH